LLLDDSALRDTAPATKLAGEAGEQSAASSSSPRVGQPEVHAEDRVIGSADAPITIIEYASFTCPHCASFHNETLPQVKAAYVDRGFARLVFRDFPLDGLALRATLLTRCAAADRYFGMVEVLFRSQDSWTQAQEPVKALEQIGRVAGVDPAKIEQCLADQAEADRIIADRKTAREDFGIDSTPSFLINGTLYSGALSFAEMDKILKGLLPDS
jgi:protein-disulfide isomerase